MESTKESKIRETYTLTEMLEVLNATLEIAQENDAIATKITYIHPSSIVPIPVETDMKNIKKEPLLMERMDLTITRIQETLLTTGQKLENIVKICGLKEKPKSEG